MDLRNSRDESGESFLLPRRELARSWNFILAGGSSLTRGDVSVLRMRWCFRETL